MRLPKEATLALSEEALSAFWQIIARHFPHATSGDLSWDCLLNLQAAAEQAIEQWVHNNVPDAAA